MPEDPDVAEEELEDDRQVNLSRPRMTTTFEEDEDDDNFDNTGEEIEEEYVSSTLFLTGARFMESRGRK